MFLENVNNEYTKVIGQYTGCRNKIECKCLICGNNYFAIPRDVAIGKIHKECSYKIGTQKRTKTKEQFVKEVSKIIPHIEIIGEYKNAKEKISCLCLKHNQTFEGAPTHLLQGKCGCEQCKSDKIRNKLMKSHDQFVDDLYKVNNNITVLGKYNGAHNDIKCRCNMCGNVWFTKPDILLQGYGCVACSESRGEKRIRRYLNDNNIKYIYEKKYDDLVGVGKHKLSYDFYLEDYNCLIEYQGQYHDGTAGNQTLKQLEIQKEHDKRKKHYANTHNIKLLEIWYWDYNNIETILGKEFVLNKDPVTTTVI